MRTPILLTAVVVGIVCGPSAAVTKHPAEPIRSLRTTASQINIADLYNPRPLLDCVAGTVFCLPPPDNCAADGPNCQPFVPGFPDVPAAQIPLPPAIGALLAGISALAGLAMRRRPA